MVLKERANETKQKAVQRGGGVSLNSSKKEVRAGGKEDDMVRP